MCCAVRQFSVGSNDNDNDECDFVLITDTVCSYQISWKVIAMLKWAYNPQLRANSVPETVDIELDVVREDPGAKSRYLTERKSSKKKVSKKSLTVHYATARRNSFTIVKHGFKAIKTKQNMSSSALNINEADHGEEEEEEKIIKEPEPEEETKKAIVTDVAKCHFSRVFEPNSGG